MSPLERNRPLRRAAFSVAVAAAVNLLLLGALLGLNGTPPPAAPAEPQPARLRAVRMESLPRTAPHRPAPAARPPESSRPREIAARDVPLLPEAPRMPGVRALDFVPAAGVSDFGVVPFDLPLPGAETPAGIGVGAIGGGSGDTIGTVGSGDLDRAPQEVFTPIPPYPAAARRAGIEGKVDVRLLLSTEGAVERVEIVRWEGHSSFPEVIRRSLESWRFTPAVRDGRPIRIWKPYVVKFKLDD